MAREAASWLCDLDGVLIKDDAAIPGAPEFLARLDAADRPYLILTNNSMYTPSTLCERLGAMGFAIRASQLWTSALATARFAATQRPGGGAFLLGDESLRAAFLDAGYHVDDASADYVVVGDPTSYSFEAVTTAIRLVERGAHLLATNPEATGPSAAGPLPACGAITALVARATGVTPYVVGKPNPLMLTEAMRTLGASAASTVIVGDRMETDVQTGVEAGLQTILVLSGVTRESDVDRYPYRPDRVVGSVADLLDELA